MIEELKDPNSERVSVYVDGFNLYYGIKNAGWNHVKWLDLKKLAHSLLVEKQQLVQVKYFTTKLSGGNPEADGARVRQQAYLAALESQDIHMIYGKFTDHDDPCWYCNQPKGAPKEKMTDVKIAVNMLQDAFHDRYDTAILISVDTDQVPTIKAVRDLGKKVKVAFPKAKNQFPFDIVRMANVRFEIKKSVLEQCQLPDIIAREGKKELYRPREWK